MLESEEGKALESLPRRASRVANGCCRPDGRSADYYPRTMDELRDEMMAGDSFNTLLFGIFGAMALLLAAVSLTCFADYSSLVAYCLSMTMRSNPTLWTSDEQRANRKLGHG